MKRFVCAIEYMGLGYQGWQSQKGMRTVQSEVELALAKGKKDYDKRKKIIEKQQLKEIKDY